MKIEDYGIILSANKFGDSSLIVKILSREYGAIKGLIKGQKKNGPIAQPGNLVHFTWNARLSEHLGMISLKLEKAYALLNFSDFKKILSISSICSLVDALLPEREIVTDIFDNIRNYLSQLPSEEEWLKEYVMFEMYILEKTGFGIELNRCAVTGIKENITYISPKTGSAVSKDVGEPYKAKLFSIPSFFMEKNAEISENQGFHLREIIDGLEITRYFLAKHFFAENMTKIPVPCIQFMDEIIRLANSGRHGINDQRSDDEARQNGNNQF